MVVVAIVGILASMAFYGLDAATRSSRVSNARFTLTSAFDQARMHAMSRGVDTYLIFENLESQEGPVLGDPVRLLVVEDRAGLLRSTPDQIMGAINAAADPEQLRVVDAVTGGGVSYANSWLTPTPLNGEAAGSCEEEEVPQLREHLNLSRLGRGACTGKAWCSFCVTQEGRCIGAVRFAPDGMLTTVTGGPGAGGVLRIVNLDNDVRSFCLAYSEPAGVVLTY